MPEPKTRLEIFATTVQVLSVVCGVVISVLSFNATRAKEADARRLEAEKPLRELRRSVYLEALKTAAIIATPEGRSKDSVDKAKLRFRELYVAELTMVEDPNVEGKMVALARAVDPGLLQLNAGQEAALDLARALRDSYNNPPAESARRALVR